MNVSHYTIVIEEQGKVIQLESFANFELAVQNAIEKNLETGALTKVLYHSTLGNSDFEVWPLDGLAGEYVR